MKLSENILPTYNVWLNFETYFDDCMLTGVLKEQGFALRLIWFSESFNNLSDI